MTDILVPFEQEGTKATVRAWLKKVGDRVEINDPLVELETDKVTQEVPSPAAGVLAEILLGTDAQATPGAVLGRLGLATSATNDAPAAVGAGEAESRLTAALPPTGLSATSSEIGLSPAVRRAVLQHGIDPATIAGTGRSGRITRADVERLVAAGGAAASALSEADGGDRSMEKTEQRPAQSSGVRSVPHDRMRLAIAQNMQNSVTVAPHVTAVFECDFSAVAAHRGKHKAAFETQGAKLTYTAYFVAACVEAMRAAPAINSRWFEDRLEIYDDIGIGVGTALGEKGLVVPVIQRAQSLSLLGVSQALSDLATRARSGRLTPADMRGGTFTISNHGVSGSLFATPIIINQPQSAILGVGKVEKRVVVREVSGIDTIQVRPMCYVSLTIDHRVVDGHQTNAWLSRFVEVIEGWGLDV